MPTGLRPFEARRIGQGRADGARAPAAHRPFYADPTACWLKPLLDFLPARTREPPGLIALNQPAIAQRSVP